LGVVSLTEKDSVCYAAFSWRFPLFKIEDNLSAPQNLRSLRYLRREPMKHCKKTMSVLALVFALGFILNLWLPI